MTDKILNIDHTTVGKIILHDATGLAPTFKYILLFPPLVGHFPPAPATHMVLYKVSVGSPWSA